MTDYTPIRTEYKGIVFDSKSEAVFARTLDLASKGHYIWEYHPDIKKYSDLSKIGHEWDFNLYGIPIPLHKTIWSLVIEYKPSKPTWTYIKNLTMATSKSPVNSILVWGNPWEGPQQCCLDSPPCSYVAYPIYSNFGEYGWGGFCAMTDSDSEDPVSYLHPIKELLGITEEMTQEAKRYRFDLQN